MAILEYELSPEDMEKLAETVSKYRDKIKVYGSKFITFPVDKWVAKIELVKKNAMPK